MCLNTACSQLIVKIKVQGVILCDFLLDSYFFSVAKTVTVTSGHCSLDFSVFYIKSCFLNHAVNVEGITTLTSLQICQISTILFSSTSNCYLSL